LTWVFFVFLIITFCFRPSTLSCSIIEFHDFIQFAFKCGYPNIMIELNILHLDLSMVGSSFFYFLFFCIFFNFYPTTLYLLVTELQFLFFFVFDEIIMFSFDLLGIALRILFPAFFPTRLSQS